MPVGVRLEKLPRGLALVAVPRFPGTHVQMAKHLFLLPAPRNVMTMSGTYLKFVATTDVTCVFIQALLSAPAPRDNGFYRQALNAVPAPNIFEKINPAFPKVSLGSVGKNAISEK